MLGHMKKRRINTKNSFRDNTKRKNSETAANWRDTAEEVFGHVPSTALNLRGLRNREGLTQAELGKTIGVEQSNISKMECGKRQIGIKIAKKLEKVFDIDYRLFL
jgi:DNA-binding XRE family transcriptional regulator